MNQNIEDKLFVDIETAETDNPDVIADIDAKVVPPGTMSKPETIAGWTEKDRPEVVRREVAKTSLEGSFGRLASIAFTLGNGTVVSATSVRPAFGDQPAAYDPAQERKLFERFWTAIDRYRDELGRVPTVVGHNVAGFDIRWLWQRSVILDVRPPLWWPVSAKPWEADRVFDTMVAWCGVGNRISQDRLCLALGLPRKAGFDGSMVGEAWRAGEFEKIRTYNASDVETVREIWKRIVGYREPVVEVADEMAQESVAAVVEIAEERDAVIAESVRTSQNAGTFRPGFRPGHVAQTGAAA